MTTKNLSKALSAFHILEEKFKKLNDSQLVIVGSLALKLQGVNLKRFADEATIFDLDLLLINEYKLPKVNYLHFIETIEDKTVNVVKTNNKFIAFAEVESGLILTQSESEDALWESFREALKQWKAYEIIKNKKSYEDNIWRKTNRQYY